MIRVSISELRNNISHYVEACLNETVQITKNGNVVAILSSPKNEYYDTLYRLCGCLKEGDTGQSYDDMVGEEILRKCGY